MFDFLIALHLLSTEESGTAWCQKEGKKAITKKIKKMERVPKEKPAEGNQWHQRRRKAAAGLGARDSQ